MDTPQRRKAALHNLGCKVNAYETDAMSELFEKNGYEIVDFDKKADVYVINTCTVTNIAAGKSRQMIHKAKKMNKDAVVVAVGCYVQEEGEKIYADEAVDIAIGNNKKGDIIKILDEYFAFGRSHDVPEDINNTAEYDDMQISGCTREHNRVFLKIQDGCNQFCSYCVIPYVRGRIRSRKPEDIVREIAGLAKNGVKEIVFTGIHLSSYGADLGDGTELIDVIEKAHDIDGIERIRTGSLEPRVIDEDFLERLSRLPKFCPHFHLSLQSGCDEVLKRMNRKYTTDEYLQKCRLIRKYFETAGITTDVIAGFPQETEEEFNRTLEFVKEVMFSKIHVFKYSKRRGTKAEKMDNRISEQVKRERSERLIKLAAEMQQVFMKSFIGKYVEVLWEEIIEYDKKTYISGYTKEYVRVAMPCDTDKHYINKTSRVFILNMLNCEILLAQSEKMY